MKKHLILLFLMGMFAFTSCSDDDEDTDNSITGTWTLQSVNPPLIDLNCPQPSTISFTGDGTAAWSLYLAENDCTLETSTGTWENTSGNNYTIFVPEFGNIPGSVEFINANTFTFTTPVGGTNAVLTFNRQI